MNTAEIKERIVIRGEGFWLAHLFFVVPFIILNVQYVLAIMRRRRLQKQFRAVLQGGAGTGNSFKSEKKSEKTAKS
ncbi:hypothetical protein L5515_010445 [Caenorhabditis briggsae]|uniref:Uncharacterized protein n=1 Tax=Caenorhabditis briggsae TaxID=6238 RepID=A0AAE9AF60_CAEBR|nr:hypothetical protein L3Y34_003291 [Caenorhabditis briggsae]UMM26958.1 hypothetical protein L5515_010445 [Caenorhabditis briggsae]